MADPQREFQAPIGVKAVLRPFGRGDLLPYWKAINDPEISHLTGHVPIEFGELEEWFASRIQVPLNNIDTYFAICTPDSDVFLGSLFLWNSNALDGHCELSVFISEKSLWGQGYGCHAVNEALLYAFGVLHLEKVYLHVDNWNERAIKCYHKCGFVEEGVLRRHRRTPSGWSDMVVMSVLRSA